MTRQYQRNPATELNHKRSNLIVSVAMFYKRPFTFEDIRVINPRWCERRDQVNLVLNRLIRNGYLIKSGDTYQLTEYGHRQNAEYLAWKKIFKKGVRDLAD
jgi:hypothetical protein